MYTKNPQKCEIISMILQLIREIIIKLTIIVVKTSNENNIVVKLHNIKHYIPLKKKKTSIYPSILILIYNFKIAEVYVYNHVDTRIMYITRIWVQRRHWNDF